MATGPRPRQSVVGSVRADFRRGLVAHLPYVAVGAGILLLSIPVGAFAFSVATEISVLPLSRVASIVVPQESTAVSILVDDMGLFSLLVVGAVTFGLVTVFGLLVQGVVTGYFIASASDLGLSFLLVGLLPHGLPKLLGFVLAAAVSFRLVACVVAWSSGRRDRVLSDAEWRQTGLVLCCGWCSLALSALVEAHLTFRLTELLF